MACACAGGATQNMPTINANATTSSDLSVIDICKPPSKLWSTRVFFDCKEVIQIKRLFYPIYGNTCAALFYNRDLSFACAI
jgi:hypothetical protein